MVELAERIKKRGAPGEVWNRLYGLIKADKQLEPATEPLKVLEEWEQVPEAKSLLVKGPRVALRRWFSWCQAASWFVSEWHTRLLALSWVGIATKAYKLKAVTPMWGDSRD